MAPVPLALLFGVRKLCPRLCKKTCLRHVSQRSRNDTTQVDETAFARAPCKGFNPAKSNVANQTKGRL